MVFLHNLRLSLLVGFVGKAVFEIIVIGNNYD